MAHLLDMTRKASEPRAAPDRVTIVDAGAIRIADIVLSRRELAFEFLARDASIPQTLIVVHTEGSASYLQHQRTVRLNKGEWTILESERMVLWSPGLSELLLLLMPVAQVATGKSIQLNGLAAGAMCGSKGASALLFSATHRLIKDLRGIGVRGVETLEQNLYRIVRLCLHERLAANMAGLPRDARAREKALQYIEAHLRDQVLSIADVARHLGCSERYLHKIFARIGKKLGRYILGQRLDRCRDDVLAPTFAAVPLIKIAMSWGFNSAPHFSRAYRSRFGVSPQKERRLRLHHLSIPPVDASGGAGNATKVR